MRITSDFACLGWILNLHAMDISFDRLHFAMLPLFHCLQAYRFGVLWQAHWSAASWPKTWFDSGLTRNIVLFEIFPILVFLEWGGQFRYSHLLFHSNNKGMAYTINCMSSKSILAVLHCLVFKCLPLNVWIKVNYFPGHTNVITDFLSWFQMESFRGLVPDADPLGSPCQWMLLLGILWPLPRG